jgi:uncharacterized protein (TIGR03118 family)
MRHLRVVTVVAASLFLTANAHAHAKSYREVDLVSNVAQRARSMDPNLVNPWGLVETPNGSFRVANEATATSTAYGPRGRSVGPVFDVGEEGPGVEGGPTGIVVSRFRGEFLIHAGDRTRPARFIFATIDGSLWAWNPDLDAEHAQRVSHDAEAVYTGLALASFRKHPYLYVANFRGGEVEVYDSHFAEVDLPDDFDDPELPAGYAPFNVANIDGRIYVAYAKQGAEEEEPGPGLGIVSVFDAGGRFVRRFASHGTLNAPWGIALAPSGFGRFSKAVVVGNFGDGTLNAFDKRSGRFLGQLEDADGHAIAIEGLWGIAFSSGDDEDDDDGGDRSHSSVLGLEHGSHGDGDNDDDDDGDDDDNDNSARLYFAAGIEDETQGLFGYIVASPGSRDHHSDENALAGTLAASELNVTGLRVALAGTQPIRIGSGEGVRFAITMPTGAALDLAIFDAAGRLVARPARAAALTGASELRWDATTSTGEHVSPGIYFWRAQAARQTMNGRIVLLP